MYDLYKNPAFPPSFHSLPCHSTYIVFTSSRLWRKYCSLLSQVLCSNAPRILNKPSFFEVIYWFRFSFVWFSINLLVFSDFFVTSLPIKLTYISFILLFMAMSLSLTSIRDPHFAFSFNRCALHSWGSNGHVPVFIRGPGFSLHPILLSRACFRRFLVWLSV